MSLIVFVGVNLVGDPVDMLINPEADQFEIDRVIRELGLDRPVAEQYWYFMINAFQGDLGRSFVFGEPRIKADYPAYAGNNGAGVILTVHCHFLWHPAWRLCWLKANKQDQPHHHGKFYFRLFDANLLGWYYFDYVLFGKSWLAAINRPR